MLEGVGVVVPVADAEGTVEVAVTDGPVLVVFFFEKRDVLLAKYAARGDRRFLVDLFDFNGWIIGHDRKKFLAAVYKG